MPRVVLFVFIVAATPFFAHAAVLINEVAWMGTTIGPNEEWIELYNEGSESVSLDGWVVSDDVSVNINLAGAVGAGEYVLLERSDDETVPGISALITYTGALSNDGRTLRLLRDDSTVEDEVEGGAAWENIGGDNITKDTAQRTQSGWVTGVPTPGEENVSTGSVDVEDETEEETDTPSSTSETVSVRSGNSAPSSKKKTPTPQEPIEPVLTLLIKAPKTVYVNQEVDFEVIPSGLGKTSLNSLAYLWNFGDTYTGASKKTTHIFAYPGEYIVVVNASFAKHNESIRHEIKVLPVSFALSRTTSGDILLKNNAKYEVDIGGFVLRGNTSFTFPQFTLMKAGGTLTISKERVGTTVTSTSLFDTQKVLVVSDISKNNSLTKPTPARTVVQQAQEAVTNNVENATSTESYTDKPQETIIRIGNTSQNIKKEGAVHNIFKKIAYFFGF